MTNTNKSVSVHYQLKLETEKGKYCPLKQDGEEIMLLFDTPEEGKAAAAGANHAADYANCSYPRYVVQCIKLTMRGS